MLKSRIDDLAIFGGAPAFADSLHVGRPNFGDRDTLMARINEMLDRRWLSNSGPFEQEFERRVAEIAGVKHAIAMCNGTVALEIAIRGLDLKGEVIVPSFTFVATAHALQWQEITPVFADIDPESYTLDPASVERLITPRTTGIVGVHVFGRACDVEALAAIARRHRLKLLFDAAHAFGASHRGAPIGSFGDAEVFSFHATKFVNAFEGGAIVTNDDALAQKVRWMKNFGFSTYDQVDYLGINGKMTEISAAMGLTSLEAIAGFVEVNRANYGRYRARLADLPGVRLIAYDTAERNNYQYVILEVDEARAGLGRDALVALLHAENILARRYFYPGCHQMEPYRSYFPHAGMLLPNTNRLCSRVLALPTGTAVEPEAIDRVCDIVRFALANGPAITERFAQTERTSVVPEASNTVGRLRS
ncbi:MAG TPA: DegT/DnrJ/EryC1/StrS family aminotransferase [Oscillatoriaceae cyanobacterium]